MQLKILVWGVLSGTTHFQICVGTKNFFRRDAEIFPSRRSDCCVVWEDGGIHVFVKFIRNAGRFYLMMK